MAAAEPFSFDAFLTEASDFWSDEVERSPEEAKAVAVARIVLMDEEIDRLEAECKEMKRRQP
jgi:hypothetical protein